MQAETARAIDKISNCVRLVQTSIRQLDIRLGGGLKNGWTHQIFGHSGCGKTQTCLQIATVASQKMTVLYVDSEGSFDTSRIKVIAEAEGLNPKKALASIYYIRTGTMQEFYDYIMKDCEALVEKKKIGLVIVDSIMGNLRPASLPHQMAKRQSFLIQILDKLNYIALKHNPSVVFTNQVLTKFSRVKRNQDDASGGNIILHYSKIIMEFKKLPSNHTAITFTKAPFSTTSTITSGNDSDILIKIDDTGVHDVD